MNDKAKMAIRTYWYDAEQTIYITHVEGTWTMDDFYRYFEDTEALSKVSRMMSF